MFYLTNKDIAIIIEIVNHMGDCVCCVNRCPVFNASDVIETLQSWIDGNMGFIVTVDSDYEMVSFNIKIPPHTKREWVEYYQMRLQYPYRIELQTNGLLIPFKGK